ncbi:MAG: hypothetical protein Ct9H300mP1_03120 [Planctomycetaceae bacterium]|nr:MAG: hypothetical protein Ct9H300mP1_03120 [Planctomycetaceae bacterium]
MEDLSGSGQLDETLVAMFGEFGRTPKINKKTGRDHWGAVQSTVLCGGGIRGGQVYGTTDRDFGLPDEQAGFARGHAGDDAPRAGNRPRVGNPRRLGRAPPDRQRAAPGRIVRVGRRAPGVSRNNNPPRVSCFCSAPHGTLWTPLESSPGARHDDPAHQPPRPVETRSRSRCRRSCRSNPPAVRADDDGRPPVPDLKITGDHFSPRVRTRAGLRCLGLCPPRQDSTALW